ncbi:hypothetical protein KZ483_02570 [Paenibacillus sp. sptzw28]|uniref:hypothetical protein n=1 Tax=Paenibacillus sp. sptzw28 TaxID=715179 RepID=UPI001C6E938B|nr:hypothetical protein [Paenibacillus sp. sptzw28]QYR21940.1 hypothetical protein KZ483_02570 [Paenibacillus sp. sptzw28]
MRILIIVAAALFTSILLLILKNIYFSQFEFVTVILGSSAIALMCRYIIIKRATKTIPLILALIAFIMYWIFSYTDLIGDHYLYYLPTGDEDGRALTLGETISEFNDDLLVFSLSSPVIVLAISIVLNLYTKLKYEGGKR